MSNIGPSTSHFFFIDDYLLFTKAKYSQVRLVKDVLSAFYLIIDEIMENIYDFPYLQVVLQNQISLTSLKRSIVDLR
ncbi:hypothetical protein CR513_17399, partial [Mucuna pruriens]